MIGLLFDLVAAGFLAAIGFIAIQFQTGFLIGRKFKLWRYHFKIQGIRGKELGYSIWKEEP